MRVTTTSTFSIASGKLLHRSWYEYDGAVAWVKGATQQQDQIAAQQKNFYSTVLQNYQTNFANQSNILASLTAGWQSTFNQGPGQYGFTPAEDAALRTQASEGTARTYNQALTALNQQIGARGGGNTPGVVSGPDQQLQAEVAKAGAADIANKQLGITTSGYDVGRTNYLNAGKELAGTAQLYSPQSYGGLADTSGNNAFQSASTIQKLNQAASPWNVIAPILGGVAGSFLGPIGTTLGAKAGSAIAGGGGGSTSTPVDWGAANDATGGFYNPLGSSGGGGGSSWDPFGLG